VVVQGVHLVLGTVIMWFPGDPPVPVIRQILNPETDQLWQRIPCVTDWAPFLSVTQGISQQ